MSRDSNTLSFFYTIPLAHSNLFLARSSGLRKQELLLLLWPMKMKIRISCSLQWQMIQLAEKSAFQRLLSWVKMGEWLNHEKYSDFFNYNVCVYFSHVIKNTLTKLSLPHAVINVPVNISRIAPYKLKQPPWIVWWNCVFLFTQLRHILMFYVKFISKI